MKDKIISILFILFLELILLLNIISPDTIVSTSERRKLETFPEFSMLKIMKGDFFEEVDNYTTDQFVFRDYFRNIKATVNYYLFNKLDNNGIYIIDDYIFKSDYPTNIKSIENFVEKINSIDQYLTDENKKYYSIVPDKNYYVGNNKYLNIDYNILYEKIKNINYEYIELRDILSLEDYYKTDTHWKQENLCKVVNRLGASMSFNANCNYKKEVYNEFYGVYYGQSALNLKPDKLVYLINEDILNSVVYYYEDQESKEVYKEENLKNLDSYDIYLSGASSYIEIENKKNKSGRELVIFRDSFGSSLAPLLIEFYSKITLIDIRYINSENYLQLIDFKNQDVLFLYSTLIVNNSSTLK